jgi:hypothetical protein
MDARGKRTSSICTAVVAMAALSIGVARAADAPSSATPMTGDRSIALADTTNAPLDSAGEGRAYPVHDARVRAAAAQGPEALRRYIWRTRMIYNYYYWDYAPKR